jgi:hypothetical protein
MKQHWPNEDWGSEHRAACLVSGVRPPTVTEMGGLGGFFFERKLRRNPGESELNRFLSISRVVIRDSSVVGGMPNMNAARQGPATRPLLAAKAASMIPFSVPITRSVSGRDTCCLGIRFFRRPARVSRQRLAIAQDHRPLNHILQLAQIAGPPVGLKLLERSLVDVPDLLACPAGIPPDEILHQPRDRCFRNRLLVAQL